MDEPVIIYLLWGAWRLWEHDDFFPNNRKALHLTLYSVLHFWLFAWGKKQKKI